MSMTTKSTVSNCVGVDPCVHISEKFVDNESLCIDTYTSKFVIIVGRYHDTKIFDETTGWPLYTQTKCKYRHTFRRYLTTNYNQNLISEWTIWPFEEYFIPWMRNYNNLLYGTFLGCWIQIWSQNFRFSIIQGLEPIFKFRARHFGFTILNFGNLIIFTSDSNSETEKKVKEQVLKSV